jgi:hypothetical protein
MIDRMVIFGTTGDPAARFFLPWLAASHEGAGDGTRTN